MKASTRLIFKNSNSVSQKFVRRNVNVTTTASARVPVSSAVAEAKSWKKIPSPPALPILGHMHHFLPGQMLSDFTTMNEKLNERYGPIVRIHQPFGKPMIMLYDPEASAYILRAENWSPRRPGFESIEYYRKKYKKSPEQSKLLTGLLTDHGDNWRKFRTTVNPVMMHTKTVRQYSAQLDGVAKEMVSRMKSIRDENEDKLNKNFSSEMNLWALESIGCVALGGRLNCLSQDLPDNSLEKKLIQNVSDVFHIANDLDFKPSLWKLLPTKKYKKAMKLYEQQEELAKYFVLRARKEFDSGKKRDDEEKGVLEKLLEIDERIAIIMASDMLFAGVDTAANTMTATLYLLAMNPEKQEKLRRTISNGDQKYLKACYKESLRLMPVISGNMRETTKEYNNILGYKIPKGIFVVFNHQRMSMQEHQFPRPKEYIPERWLEDSPLYFKKNAHPFTYSPFGFGVRMCIGRRIAELEIEIFLKEVIKNFKVEWSGPPPEILATSLNYIKGPFNFTFKDV
ncbi:cytochrome p450 domain-containing protein [Phthorimaea operculella]|nr:cytochrome p450 domain-containing protein [Phthorimaea operculella]